MSDLTFVKTKTILGATLLVSGCCIGAGMIGLPVLSALTGFFPSVIAMILCYLFTTLTGLFIVEATLWFEEKVNLPSIVEFALGKIGKSITIILFLFLFYCLFVAYLDAGGSMFADILSVLFPIQINHGWGIVACTVFILAIALTGTAFLDGVNRTMILGMIFSYLILVAIGLPSIQQENLRHSDWTAMFGVIPILLICFGYQNLVPSLTYYLNKNVNAIRFAIIVGNLIPFFVYFIWDYVILGLLSIESMRLGNEAEMVTELLQGAAVSSLSVLFFIKSFSLFAMLTSFLPNAVSFVDFLKDGFQKSSHRGQGLKKETMIYALVFIPPTLCALVYPRIFLHVLGFAGGFIDVLLFGMLPAAVILVGRRQRKTTNGYQVIGGNFTPILLLLISSIILLFKLRGMIFTS